MTVLSFLMTVLSFLMKDTMPAKTHRIGRRPRGEYRWALAIRER